MSNEALVAYQATRRQKTIDAIEKAQRTMEEEIGRAQV